MRPARLPRGINCLVTAVLYNPPKSSKEAMSDAQFLKYLKNCLSTIQNRYSLPGIVILGDTNTLKLGPLCSQFHMKQIVSKPTRGLNQLDSIITNIQGLS